MFVVHKAEALGELYLTVTGQYELPLNPESELALTMPSKQCTQCHDLEQRNVTASAGVIIDHGVHSEAEITCTACHNRIAHNEDFRLTLTDPESGQPNKRHENFTTMTACFRCHTQDKQRSPFKAPGSCSACHPPGFQLKPASHLQPDFFPEKHGDLGKAAAARAASSTVGAHAAAASGETSAQAEEAQDSMVEVAVGGEEDESALELLPPVSSINECYTCHSEQFCIDCHGAPMPHPAKFEENHGEYAKRQRGRLPAVSHEAVWRVRWVSPRHSDRLDLQRRGAVEDAASARGQQERFYRLLRLP